MMDNFENYSIFLPEIYIFFGGWGAEMQQMDCNRNAFVSCYCLTETEIAH